MMSSQLPDNAKHGLLQVYDADNDCIHESTPERQRWANEVQGAILFGTFISAMKLAEMMNNRLYLDLGFISRDDYIENGFPLGRAQAYKMLRISKRYMEALPDLERKMLTSKVHSSGLSGEEHDIEKVHSSGLFQWDSIGVTKLYELSRLPDDDLFQQAVENGSLTTADGRQLTLEDIREMSSRQFAKEIKELRDKFQGRLHSAEEENRKLKSEMATIKREAAKAAERFKHLQMVEEKFGGAANKLEDKKKMLENAYEYLNLFNRCMDAANLEEEEPEELVRLAQMIVQAEQTYTARIITRYRPIIHDVLEK